MSKASHIRELLKDQPDMPADRVIALLARKRINVKAADVYNMRSLMAREHAKIAQQRAEVIITVPADDRRTAIAHTRGIPGMTPFHPASYKLEDKRKLLQELINHMTTHPEEARIATGKDNPTIGEIAAEANRTIEHSCAGKVYKNDTYQVHVTEETPEGWPHMVHLSIKRLDREIIRDWRELQEIKNAIVGPECEGIELFPAESRLTDSANQYHIYCLTDPKARFPFGYTTRFVTNSTVADSKQRPR